MYLLLMLFFLIMPLYAGLSGYRFPSPSKRQLVLFITSLLVSFFVLSLVFFPEECYKAAVDGVNTWLNIVLPALLPFFIGAELLIGLGVIDFIGVMLEPLMRPLFGVPGLASFVFVLSITSGYPVGVKLTCKLRQQKKCSRSEAQKMLSFCSTSGPLFMIGAVAIGMLHNTSAGTIIAVSHYLSAILVGILFRFFIRDAGSRKGAFPGLPSISKAFRAMYRKRVEDGRPFGVLLGDAVRESVNTLLMIGGFITMFSVVIEVFSLTGLLDYLAAPLESLLGTTPALNSLIKPVTSGLLEITIGSRLISSLPSTPLLLKISAISFIIGWSGFSIHAQAVSFISKTDLNSVIYFISKFLHGTLAAFISIIIGIFTLPQKAQEAFLPEPFYADAPSFIDTFLASSKILLAIITLTVAILGISRILKSILYFKIKRS